MTVTDPATRMVSLTRAYLPIALIVLGLLVALIGAACYAAGSTEVVLHENIRGTSTQRTTESEGSPLGFVIVGCVVALAGCALQALAWRMISNSAGPRQGEAPESLSPATQPRVPAKGEEPPQIAGASMAITPPTS